MNRKKYTKKALIISIAIMLFWISLGTGTTLAWFMDTTPAVKNTFDIGELSLAVSYKRLPADEYTPVDSNTAVFAKDALYEPGYTETVYLQIQNVGEVDFEYKLSVDMVDHKDSVNIYGMNLHLPEYLRYGVVFADSEEALQRPLAQQMADQNFDSAHLNQYTKKDTVALAPGQIRYVMLVLYMPKEVGNAANYHKGAPVPWIDLGLTVFAQQAGAPLN